jgi:outer membrane protein OmpA-like peptidoglycan-associated protein
MGCFRSFAIRFGSSFLILLLLANGYAYAQTPIAGDFKGTKDPDGFKRFSGSVITAQRAQNYAEFELIVGKGDWEDKAGPKPVKKLDGKHVRTVYLMPAGVSPLEAFRNYENELAAMGFETLFKCRNPGTQVGDCGRRLVGGKLYTQENWLQDQHEAAKWVGSGAEDLFFISGRATRPTGDVYVSLFLVKMGGSQNAKFEGRASAVLDVVQVKRLEQKMAFVDAGTMQLEIEKAGRISLYGIQFDTGSATIRPQSDATLAEVARLLVRNSDWKLAVIGHTDNVGGEVFNQKLSQQRAQAVTQALSSRHKISAGRMRAQGMGMKQPLASNDSEDGRAKNRRVELMRE